MYKLAWKLGCRLGCDLGIDGLGCKDVGLCEIVLIRLLITYYLEPKYDKTETNIAILTKCCFFDQMLQFICYCDM